MALQDKLNHLFSLRREMRVTEIRPEYFTLLERLGDPHLRLPPTIHVAGTNGKGSTIAFMRAMLEQAGYSVHVFTSPHLVRFNERIVLNGAMISDAALADLLDEVFKKSDGLAQSFFEITPALAMTAFARNPADILLLETGLGGRLDQTNVIPPPLASVITTLSYDHMPMLGDTIEQIAFEKAGIIKPGTPCIVGRQIYPQVLPVLAAQAERMGARLVAETDWPRLTSPPAPSLTGPHQIQNAALAAATLLTQTQLAVPEEAMRRGIETAFWPARLQKIALPGLREGWEFWLDGGHNDSAGLVLAEQAALWARTDPKPLHIITGMQAHKDGAGFARALAPYAASVTTIPIPGHEETSAAPDALAALWRREAPSRIPVHASHAPLRDIPAALPDSAAGGRILLTGSLYLAETIL